MACGSPSGPVLAEMEAEDIDVLVVGREANARYVSGAPGSGPPAPGPSGPGCVLVRATGAVHLLSTWDEGIPDDIPHENLYGISFNADELPARCSRGSRAPRPPGPWRPTP